MTAFPPIRGLYGITPETDDTCALVRRVEAALQGGMAVLQYRAKHLPAPLRLTQIQALYLLCRGFSVPLLINDAPREGEGSWAAGWHVGAQDGDASVWAELSRQGIFGISCYADAERAAQAERAGAHYLALGSFYPSNTKPAAALVSLSTLRAIRARVAIPIVAIGGMTPERAVKVHQAGADAVAVLSDLFMASDVRAQAEAYRRVFA